MALLSPVTVSAGGMGIAGIGGALGVVLGCAGTVIAAGPISV